MPATSLVSSTPFHASFGKRDECSFISDRPAGHRWRRPIRYEAIEKESMFWPIKFLIFFGANAHLFGCMYFYAKNSVWPTPQELGTIPTTSGSLLFCEGESESENVEKRSTEAGKRYGGRITPHETHLPIYLSLTLVYSETSPEQ